MAAVVEPGLVGVFERIERPIVPGVDDLVDLTDQSLEVEIVYLHLVCIAQIPLPVHVASKASCHSRVPLTVPNMDILADR